jgi:hypothetical protein
LPEIAPSTGPFAENWNHLTILKRIRSSYPSSLG